jgi:carboxypeptidase Taq
VALYSHVERSLIRVDADEVTYPLHIVLRHRLERAMIDGDLAIADLPAAWNDGMRELLGVVPPDDAKGCMQDIHWPVGAFGYFPCYTLGAMLAAQLFRSADQAIPDLERQLADGEFGQLLGWLRTNVHGRASFPTYRELVVEATGAPLTAEPFLAHLRQRYLA